MALENNETSQRPKADAFLNVVLVAKDGSEHSVPRGGIPLSMGNQIGRSLINKQADAPEGELVEFTLKGTVRIVQEDDGESTIAL